MEIMICVSHVTSQHPFMTTVRSAVTQSSPGFWCHLHQHHRKHCLHDTMITLYNLRGSVSSQAYVTTIIALYLHTCVLCCLGFCCVVMFTLEESQRVSVAKCMT